MSSRPVGRHTFVRNGLFGGVAAAVAIGGGGDGFAEAFGGVAIGDAAIVAGVGVLVAAIAFQAWFSWQLFRQNGRLVARVGVLERNAAGEPPKAEGVPVGEPVPEFELPEIGGARRSLADLLAPGAPFALLFSDPECAACGPLLDRLGDLGAIGGDGLEVVLVTRGTAEAERTRLNGHAPATVLLQEAHEVADLLGVPAVPSAFVVDAGGRAATELVSGQEAIEALIASWRGELPELPVVGAGGGR